MSPSCKMKSRPSKPSRVGNVSIEQAAARFAALSVDKQLFVGPSVWRPTDGTVAREYYFVVAGCDRHGFFVEQLIAPAEFRLAFLLGLVPHRPLLVHDMADELEMARWCEATWPSAKTRRIRAAMEAERAEAGA